MDTTGATVRPESYALLNEEQKKKLTDFYEAGMRSTTDTEKIEKVSEETGLTIKQVKVCDTYVF